MVSCDLYSPISTHPMQLQDAEWLVILDLRPRPTWLIEEVFLVSRKKLPQILRHIWLIEEECLVARYLCKKLYLPKYTSRPSSLELPSSLLRRQEKYFLVLWDRYPRLPLPLIMNNGFREMNWRNLTTSGTWDVMKIWTGLLILSWSSLLSERHTVFLWFLVLWD